MATRGAALGIVLAATLGLGCATRPVPPISAGAAAWPEFRGSPARTGGRDGSLASPLYLVWRSRLGRGPAVEPALAGSVLCVATNARQLRLLHIEEGERLWGYRTTGTASIGPTVAGDRVYFGTEFPTAELISLALTDGTQQWRRDDLAPRGAALVRGDTLFVADDTGRLHALAARDGQTLWQTDAGGAWPAPLALESGRIIWSDQTDTLRAFAASDGRPLWTAPLAGGSRGGCALDGGRAFACGMEGIVQAFDPSDGEVLWTRDLPTRIYAAPVLGGASLFVAGLDGRVYALDATSGEVQWSLRLNGSCRASPALAGDLLLVTTMAATVELISITERRVISTLDVSRSLRVGPVTAGGRLYVVDDAGYVYAFESS